MGNQTTQKQPKQAPARQKSEDGCLAVWGVVKLQRGILGGIEQKLV